MDKVDKVNVAVECRMCSALHFIPATTEQLDKLNKSRGLIQDIFPELDASDRELLLSGTCNQCWESLFNVDDLFDNEREED